MTTYRLMDGLSGRPGNGPGVSAYSGNFLAGTMFSPIGKMLWLNGYYFWCPTGGDTGAQKFALWNRYSATAQALVSGSVVTSGTLTAGAWNHVTLPTPIQLGPYGLYVASTGWSVVTGFPDTQNQFGAAQPYVNGITNGPITAWSDLTGTNEFVAASGNYGLDQGLFSTAGTDPSVNMPNGGSNSSNFWVDVDVSDTAPAGYTGSYRVWPNVGDANSYVNDSANNFTLGMEFSLSQACSVNKIWFYSPSGVTQLPTGTGVYGTTGPTLMGSNASPSWSGAAASGWVSSTLPGVTLPAGQYKVCVVNGAGSPAIWNGATANYWSTGPGGSGLTAGPITVPNNASATSPGQSSYNAGATLTFPGTNGGPWNYWVDIEVTPLVTLYPARPGNSWPTVHRASYW